MQKIAAGEKGARNSRVGTSWALLPAALELRVPSGVGSVPFQVTQGLVRSEGALSAFQFELVQTSREGRRVQYLGRIDCLALYPSSLGNHKGQGRKRADFEFFLETLVVILLFPFVVK